MGVMPYERNSDGVISIENLPTNRAFKGNLGMKVAEDGRIWICIDGVAFIRFKPLSKEEMNGKNLRSPVFEDGETRSSKEE